MYIIYNVVLIIYWIFKLPVIIKRMLFEKGYAERLFESSGALPEERKEKIGHKNAVWIHAASVGEIVAASAVAKEVKRQFQTAHIVVSVVTATGHEMARHIIHEADEIIFFPLDLPFSTKRMLELVEPSIILILETEIWPNFIHHAKKMGIPVLMVNGRISDKSIVGYRKVRFFMKRILEDFSFFCMQSQIDAAYIKELGAPADKVIVTGNTKYDSMHPNVDKESVEKLRVEFATAEAYPVIVAGSTHPGEESMVLEAFSVVREKEATAKLIIAPRNINRGQAVKDLFISKGFTAICRSDMKPDTVYHENVIILDTIGELGRVYALSDIVFVGGSLVPIGGHNILEAAVFGKAIVVGPHMFNFKDIYGLLQRNQGCVTAENDVDLAKIFLKLSEDKEYREALGHHCMQIMKENQGASYKNVMEMRKLLEESGRLQLLTMKPQ